MGSRRRIEQGLGREPVVSACLVFMLLFGPVGCGPRAPAGMLSINGTVTLGGKPVPKGAVHFVAEDASKTRSARIDATGRFHAALWPLDYRIAVTADEHPAMVGDNGVEIPAKSLVPLKYTSAATSGLTATVDASHTTVNLDLAP